MTNTTNQTKKSKKPLFIGLAAVIGIILALTLWTRSNQKNAEELANKQAQETPSAVSVGYNNDTSLDMSATGEQGAKVRELDAQQASEARATEQSHIGLAPNPTIDGYTPSTQQNLVDANAGLNSPVPDPVQPVPQSVPQPIAVEVPAPPRVYVVTNTKEVPVPKHTPYNFTKDTDVLGTFVNLYGTVTVDSGQGKNAVRPVAGFTNRDYGREYRAEQEQLKSANAANDYNYNGEFKQGIKIAQVGKPSHEVSKTDKVNIGNNTNAQISTNNNVQTGKSNQMTNVAKIGDIWVAELETNIDSRQPSLVRARISEGVFAGAYAIGSFMKNGDGSSVIIEFSTLNVNGVDRSIPFKAVAVNLMTGSNAMATSVNRHIIPRITFETLNTAASAFASNLSSNNRQSSKSTQTDKDGKISSTEYENISKKTNKEIWRESLAQGISSGMAEVKPLIPTTPTVKVSAMPVGMFITEDLNLDSETMFQLD